MVSLLGFWSKGRIITAIRAAHKAGGQLNVRSVIRQRSRLYGAALRYFGSWREAVVAAGYDYSKVSLRPWGFWSRQEVLRSIREMKHRGLPLNATSVIRHNYALYAAALRFFGKNAWAKAVKQAGCTPVNLARRWTKGLVRDEILRLSRTRTPLRGSYLLANGCSALVWAGQRYFGNWRRAVESAGLDYFAYGGSRLRWWTKAKVIAEIWRLERRGIPLHASAVKEIRSDLWAQASRLFGGSWNAALEAAGIDHRRHAKRLGPKTWLKVLTTKELEVLERQAFRFAKTRRKRK